MKIFVHLVRKYLIIFANRPNGIGVSLLQIYELYNGGSTSAVYEIQMDALRQVERENHHHAVFTCLNPRGEIGPGLTAHTEWIFCPLEAKMYSVKLLSLRISTFL